MNTVCPNHTAHLNLSEIILLVHIFETELGTNISIHMK